jgi:hypothetical protein
MSEEREYNLTSRAQYSHRKLLHSDLVKNNDVSKKALDDFAYYVNHGLPKNGAEFAQMNIFKNLYHADRVKARELYLTKNPESGYAELSYYVLWTNNTTIAKHYHVDDKVRLVWDNTTRSYSVVPLNNEERDERRRRRQQRNQTTDKTDKSDETEEPRKRRQQPEEQKESNQQESVNATPSLVSATGSWAD